MKKCSFIVIVLIYLISCTSTPSRSIRPEWVDNKYSKYADAEYMVEIGQGSSLRAAKGDGAAALAQIFRTSIKAETTIETRYKELASNGSVQSSEETSVHQDIVQLADQELINVHYGESLSNDSDQVRVLSLFDWPGAAWT